MHPRSNNKFFLDWLIFRPVWSRSPKLLRSLLCVAALLAAASVCRAQEDWQTASWRAYVRAFVQSDGRVIDPAIPPGTTTSEGQAYTLLRAVWSNDQEVFTRVLAWTTNNLARPKSPLPSWKWGKRSDGAWGVQDDNTASDADVLLAYALFTAGTQWNNSDWIRQGREVAIAVWNEEVERIGTRWFLLPGNWARKWNPLPLNLSYYCPAILRRIASFEPQHAWAELADTTYYLLRTSLPTTGLPPDWLLLQRSTQEIVIGNPDGAQKGRFAYDAYRVYFNVALDYVWDRSQPAKQYLTNQSWLASFLLLNGTLPREVGSDAIPRLSGPEPLALHGSLYPALVLFRADAATRARAILDATYKDGIWGSPPDYYSQHLVWFGRALAEGLLPSPRSNGAQQTAR